MPFSNITLTVGEELHRKMVQDYPEVNWSAVCRSAITDYMKKRDHERIYEQSDNFTGLLEYKVDEK